MAPARSLPRFPLARVAWGVAAAIPAGFVALFFLWPVVALVATGLTDAGRLDLGGISEVLGQQRSWTVLAQTLTQASLATVVSVLHWKLIRCSGLSLDGLFGKT